MAIDTLQGAVVPVKLWTKLSDVEEAAQKQLKNVAALPWCFSHVAVMPDCHFGKGCTVGSVIAMKDAIAPSAVGVDIGCFRGDTRVLLTDNDTPDLRQLAERDQEIEVYAYSVLQKRVVCTKARAARTRRNAEIVIVQAMHPHAWPTFCTPDHEFLLVGGNYRRADSLKSNDEIMIIVGPSSTGAACVVGVFPTVVREDVYCLSVPEHNNFCLANGLFVHNCGMAAVKTNLTSHDLPHDLKALRHQIERDIPVGFHAHEHSYADPAHGGLQNPALDVLTDAIIERLKQYVRAPVQDLVNRAVQQIGTLGGGNHFVELCLDTDDRAWMMLHSGSRGIGNKIAEHHIGKAKGLIHNQELPDPDLAVFLAGTPDMEAYQHDLFWAQDYAAHNRAVMLALYKRAMQRFFKRVEFEPTIQCHHNYCVPEVHFGEEVLITRKGAIRAGKGDMGIIPGCFAAGTRVLMADGMYRNIEDVRIGDTVISGRGCASTVTNTFQRGKRRVWQYRNNNFHAETVATPDHLHFIGDMSSADYQTQGRVKVLERPTRNGSSKYGWRPLNELPSSLTLLLPRNVEFASMPNAFNVQHEGQLIAPTYAVGYSFGAFLGNGTSYYAPSTGGQISWSRDQRKTDIIERIVKNVGDAFGLGPKKYQKDRSVSEVVLHSASLARLFELFGKRTDKALPTTFWCKDVEYLRGLYDGLIDTDGHVNNETKKFTNTSTVLIEQFCIIHYLLFGYFPSVSARAPSAGGLEGVKDSSCKPSYRATSLKAPEAVLVREYQLVAMLNLNKADDVVETFDIEVDNEDHSFIANNVIVHNSMGDKSYIVRGLGNPDSFESASHGAGRKMSRGQARRTFTTQDLEALTKGVECRKDDGVLDEIPSAYKSIDAVMENQKDLVEVVAQLKGILCVKGGDDKPHGRGDKRNKTQRGGKRD